MILTIYIETENYFSLLIQRKPMFEQNWRLCKI